MEISAIINFLQTVAPAGLQESYDNTGLLTGDPRHPCTGVLVSLDATEEVVLEAASRNCNLVVAHHPVIFSGLKRINPGHYVGRAVIAAIRNNVAIYAIHTNLDNVPEGVNGKIASLLGLRQTRVLRPLPGQLRKLVTFVPHKNLDAVRDALFAAGAGKIGNYDQAGFAVEGTGSFRSLEGANPHVGEMGVLHYEPETRLELIYHTARESSVVNALLDVHPYEEVAYDLVPLSNTDRQTGSGLVGELEQDWEEAAFLRRVMAVFGLNVLKHTALTGRPVRRVAVCGGAGSFLIRDALGAGADVFLTADLKYHEFFEADGRLVLADMGHFESEQFTTDLLFERLQEKFPNFAVLKSGTDTNPVQYLI